MTLEQLVSSGLVKCVTQMHDAADRYYCFRTKRTLWIEAEKTTRRSSKFAPRYLVDDGDGSKTFYMGDDFDRAVARFLSPGKPQRGQLDARPLADRRP
jgi:hypothetical protein